MKALMIGAGGIAHQHLKALKTLGTEIYGIYDLDPAKAAALAAQYGYGNSNTTSAPQESAMDARVNLSAIANSPRCVACPLIRQTTAASDASARMRAI